jgi:integrase
VIVISVLQNLTPSLLRTRAEAGGFLFRLPVIHITHAIWKKNDQRPKTPASVRDIDIPEQLAALVREYLATIPAGHYLFATASGKPMSQRNTLRILHNRKKVGFHAFRRFRASILRKARVPGDLEKLWLCHASKSVTGRLCQATA